MSEEWVELGGLRALSVGDRERARVVVAVLHGFQMTPADLAPFARSIGVDAWFLFPEGPKTAEPTGRAWWHIDATLRLEALARGPRDFAGQHPPDLPDARARLGAFLDALAGERRGRPWVLGGFSQGGMLVLDSILRGAPRPDAMALLSSSRIAHDEQLPLLAAGRVRDLPVLVTHGHADADLSFACGCALRDCLIAAGARVDWLEFAEGHEIPLVVWRRLRKQLQALTPAASAGG